MYDIFAFQEVNILNLIYDFYIRPPKYTFFTRLKPINFLTALKKVIEEKDHNAIVKGRCCFYRSPATEVTAWSENMDTLLANQAGLDAFRRFLKSEFSEENVEFWLACEDFKNTESAEKIASKARMIYSEFIVADAPKEINIDFSTRDVISRNIEEPTVRCFDEAQKLVYSLMAKDSFPRFLKSEIYRKLVNSQQVGTHKKWLPFL